MRLVYITSSIFPNRKASAVQVMQMCAAFAANGVDTTLIARAGDGVLTPAELAREYDVPASFTIDQRPFPPGPRPADRFQLAAAWRARTPTPWVAYARGRDLTAPLVALWRGAAFALVEVHGRPASARERWLLRQIGRHPRGRLVAISDPLRDIYRHELNLPAEHLIVAPDGVDLNRFTPTLTQAEARHALNLNINAPLVVYVGGLYHGRGLEALVQATGLNAGVHLLVVGGREPAEIATWQARLAALGLPPERVTFTGYQPPSRVPLYLFAGDILAMPYSRQTLTPSGEDTTAWMSPLKMFEYLAAGRPIVATDLPALRTVLAHNENALLVPPDDAAGIAAAIAAIVSNPEQAARLSTHARQTARQHTWQARAGRILAAINVPSTLAPDTPEAESIRSPSV